MDEPLSHLNALMQYISKMKLGQTAFKILQEPGQGQNGNNKWFVRAVIGDCDEMGFGEGETREAAMEKAAIVTLHLFDPIGKSLAANINHPDPGQLSKLARDIESVKPEDIIMARNQGPINPGILPAGLQAPPVAPPQPGYGMMPAPPYGAPNGMVNPYGMAPLPGAYPMPPYGQPVGMPSPYGMAPPPGPYGYPYGQPAAQGQPYGAPRPGVPPPAPPAAPPPGGMPKPAAPPPLPGAVAGLPQPPGAMMGLPPPPGALPRPPGAAAAAAAAAPVAGSSEPTQVLVFAGDDDVCMEERRAMLPKYAAKSY